MLTVHEVSERTGVSVRTLHHYDAIGLLTPAEVTQAGYRLYDDGSLKRLHSILFFRELQFSLKEIKGILDDPGFDPQKALDQQIRLLELQRERIDRIIKQAKDMKKGDRTMGFDIFDQREIEKYKQEAKEKWGGTEAYKESERKAAGRTSGQESGIVEGLMDVFRELGALRELPPEDPAVQEKVAYLQQYITDHYYACTNEILKGLGQMYVCDERFRENIDRAAGEGTAEFSSKAIAAYCS